MVQQFINIFLIRNLITFIIRIILLFILFIITFIVLALARLMLARLETKAGR